MSARDDVCPLCRERPVEMEMEGRVLVCRPCGEVLFWLALPERTNEEREAVYRALRRGTSYEQPGDADA